ncbi:MAG: TetR/AcrR family transcriptional regulator [Hamadaea sp.]|uniref:TetR/AcrR family transcriptional regulator n=1 Tax=Hamadaea sp. TaxID=2024425 RepID=UPI001838C6D5|nr:TetR/AcrR family transcriptional regulator [Hamadaea sp.]NUT20935.1 TetR/AcrR family transcriptional regulator [Hamadaea sp.]
MAHPVKRTYRSPARAAAAASTRERIRDAAQRLFTGQGFAATTMKQVAAAAGVGERTLYDAFPTKVKLFGHTLGVATVGDEEPVRVADRPEIAAARQAADPRLAIERFVAYGSDLLDRAGDLIMVSVEAAGADPDMRAAADAGSQAHHEVMLAFAEALHDHGALRPGLDTATAADILYALSSPHLHQLLRRHRGWDSQRYRSWLTDALVRELLP